MNSRPAPARRSALAFLLLAGIQLQACSAGVAAPQEGLPITAACFISGTAVVPVTLEVASTPQQRRKGLMRRSTLAPNHGMLFQYQRARAGEHGFWMYRTLIPLDIAYLDDKGTIGSIRHMVPCTSDSGSGCPTYPAGVPFVGAVEMNAGFFTAHGIGPGDRLMVGGDQCSAP